MCLVRLKSCATEPFFIDLMRIGLSGTSTTVRLTDATKTLTTEQPCCSSYGVYMQIC